MIAVTLAAELLTFDVTSGRARVAFEALTRASAKAGVVVQSTTQYQGGSDLLLLWGPGHPARFEPMARQVAAGGHVVAMDLAYWDRQRRVRVSIDAPHPQRWVMRLDWPPSRFLADPIAQTVTNAWRPDGPVVIAGIGPKAATQYGPSTVDAWERAQVAACQARWNRPIWYRAKKTPGYALPGTRATTTAPIEQVLAGASLVITWHSNVAVDAIRLGIPVVCRDGAAAAVCPSEMPADPQPIDPATRDRFLANLAWFQWDLATEPAACWTWLRELLA